MSTAAETQSLFSFEPEAKRRKISCELWVVIQGICWSCEQQMGEDYGKAFDYLGDGMRLSNKAVQLLRQYRSDVCFRQKKLHLVLDLDHTLIHTRRVAKLKDEEKYLIEQAGSRKGLWRLTLSDHDDFLVKFRPFVTEFLSKATELFEMYVYTKGSPDYAEAVVRLLDPQEIYFGRRIITRKDSPRFKTLDLVLAVEPSVIIVDDTREVWPDHWMNLIQIVRYNYFHQKAKKYPGLKFYSEEMTDESENGGALADVLKFLEKIHGDFFNDEIDSRDVRLLM